MPSSSRSDAKLSIAGFISQKGEGCGGTHLGRLNVRENNEARDGLRYTYSAV